VIRGVGQVLVSVSDLDRSVAFYRDTLGLDHLFTVADQGIAFLLAGDVRIYLAEADSLPSTPTLYFLVDDIDAAHGKLHSRGVEFRRDPHVVYTLEDRDGWMAFFADPDGITLALMEERARPPA
jgi:catechol 2,3-dioxygenase-like lactoylglutathione lyase family enzyme